VLETLKDGISGVQSGCGWWKGQGAEDQELGAMKGKKEEKEVEEGKIQEWSSPCEIVAEKEVRVACRWEGTENGQEPSNASFASYLS
jgi:hypothetical protein